MKPFLLEFCHSIGESTAHLTRILSFYARAFTKTEDDCAIIFCVNTNNIVIKK